MTIDQGSFQDLLNRIRGEYTEMPGLRLTLAQACRLWDVDTATCHAILATLITEGFLRCTVDATFIALPTSGSAHARQLKVPRPRRTHLATPQSA